MDEKLHQESGQIPEGHGRGLRALFLLAFGGHVQGAVEAEGVPRVGEGGKPRKSGRREGVPETHGGALQRRPDIRFSAEPQH